MTIEKRDKIALSAVRSILILEGTNPETHEGVVTMLSLRFIKPGLLPVEIVKSYKVLLSRRTDVDYGDFDMIGENEAADSIRITEEMIKIIEIVRKNLIKDGK